ADEYTHVAARYAIGGTPIHLRLELDPEGRVLSFVFDRWGDPDGGGTWGWHPFGGVATAWTTFAGLTIPSAGRTGWFYGTPEWARGEFFRYRITELRPAGAGRQHETQEVG